MGVGVVVLVDGCVCSFLLFGGHLVVLVVIGCGFWLFWVVVVFWVWIFGWFDMFCGNVFA